MFRSGSSVGVLLAAALLVPCSEFATAIRVEDQVAHAFEELELQDMHEEELAKNNNFLPDGDLPDGVLPEGVGPRGILGAAGQARAAATDAACAVAVEGGFRRETALLRERKCDCGAGMSVLCEGEESDACAGRKTRFYEAEEYKGKNCECVSCEEEFQCNNVAEGGRTRKDVNWINRKLQGECECEPGFKVMGRDKGCSGNGDEERYFKSKTLHGMSCKCGVSNHAANAGEGVDEEDPDNPDNNGGDTTDPDDDTGGGDDGGGNNDNTGNDNNSTGGGGDGEETGTTNVTPVNDTDLAKNDTANTFLGFKLPEEGIMSGVFAWAEKHNLLHDANLILAVIFLLALSCVIGCVRTYYTSDEGEETDAD